MHPHRYYRTHKRHTVKPKVVGRSDFSLGGSIELSDDIDFGHFHQAGQDGGGGDLEDGGPRRHRGDCDKDKTNGSRMSSAFPDCNYSLVLQLLTRKVLLLRQLMTMVIRATRTHHQQVTRRSLLLVSDISCWTEMYFNVTFQVTSRHLGLKTDRNLPI